MDHRQMLIRKIRSMESRYNPEVRLLRSAFSSPGYHTTIKAADYIHSTRDSLNYALGLLDTELPEYEQQALDIIERVVSLQDSDRSHDTFGIWPWFYEEPLDQMAPPDWNWADFCGSKLLLAVKRHGHRFPEPLREAAAQSVCNACEAIIKRNVGPDYTNIAILGALVTLVAGEQFGHEAYAAYGLERLIKLYDYTKPRQAFQEYNSPVYTCVALLELSKLREEARSGRAVEISEQLLRMTWKTVAEHYHVRTKQWSGPHARCYETLLNDHTKAFLQIATEGALMFFPWEELPYEEEWYKSGVLCPPEYLAFFTVQNTGQIRQLFEGNEGEPAGKWAITYRTQQYSLGSFDQMDFWNQRRPLLAYIDNGGSPTYMRLRFLHDGYDYCSARFRSCQEQSDMLLGIDFVTDGGDTHPSLDKIEGVIEAGDLRLRLEVGGCLDRVSASALEGGAEIEVCGLYFRIGNLFTGFSELSVEEQEQRLSWEIHRDETVLYTDLVLYSGPRVRLDFRKLQQAALLFSFSVDEDSSNFEHLDQPSPVEIVAGTQVRIRGFGRVNKALELNLQPAPGSL